jgi:hypothetical protein
MNPRTPEKQDCPQDEAEQIESLSPPEVIYSQIDGVYLLTFSKQSPMNARKDPEYIPSEDEGDSCEDEAASDTMSVIAEEPGAAGASAAGDAEEDDEDSDGEEDYEEGEEDGEDELMAGEDNDSDSDMEYVEVVTANGDHQKCRVSRFVPAPEKVELGVLNDARFKNNSSRGAARLAMVINRAVSLGRIDVVYFQMLTIC